MLPQPRNIQGHLSLDSPRCMHVSASVRDLLTFLFCDWWIFLDAVDVFQIISNWTVLLSSDLLRLCDWLN